MNDGKKKKPQKHQNKTAFKILFNPLALDVHKKVSFVGYFTYNKDYASDASTNLTGNLLLINIKKCQNQPSAIIATKRIYLEPT